MKQYDAIIIGFGKAGKHWLPNFPTEDGRSLSSNSPMKCTEGLALT